MHSDAIQISVIVPVYNNPKDLRECLFALLAGASSVLEIIVVDDASTDDTVSVAREFRATVLQLEKNSGPAVARNYGAKHARGNILFFVDADVVVAPSAIARVVQSFSSYSDVVAVFGSYDAYPRASGIVSRYRNLLHHFVHQNGNPEASTFWAGCGAIRRDVFEAVGGFDGQRYPKSSIEDIELGYRLRQKGFRIALDKTLQGTHLKRWTLWSLIKTDVFNRAVPWSRLILERRNSPNDLNLKGGQRLSGLLVLLASAFIVAALLRMEMLALGATAVLAVCVINRDLYMFFWKQHGFIFSAAGFVLHFLYFLYSALSYIYVWTGLRLERSNDSRSKAISAK